MSQIEHTLTAEHLLKVMRRLGDWTSNGCGILSEYLKQHPLTLTFELPPPWRTDIENAPRDGRSLLVLVFGRPLMVHSIDEEVWFTWEDHPLTSMMKKHITAWMEIPALPERI